MYKSKLQEYCQRRNWELPEYTTVRDGPDHMPRFTATVNVLGQIFETPAKCKSSKDAQNTAARIAFEHFTAPPPPLPSPSSSTDAPPPAAVNSLLEVAPLPSEAPPCIVPPVSVSPSPETQPIGAIVPLPLSPLASSLPNPPPGFLAPRNDANTKPVNGEVLKQNVEDTKDSSVVVHRIGIDPRDKMYKDTLHMYKNRLQQYAQKQILGFPVYTSEAEGPPHARRFKSRVSLGGKSYETLEFFPSLKEAEQAAAKAACQALSVDGIQEDGCLYKNLLQEFAQKKGLPCPSYDTVRSGLSHLPVFVSTVEVGSDTFKGAEAKTKKQAEMNAAKAAHCALAESCTVAESSGALSANECTVADNLTQDIQLTGTTEKHRDRAGEEFHVHTKKAKTSPENVKAPLPGPSHGDPPYDNSNLISVQIDVPTSTEPVERSVEIQPSHDWKTVVVPRTSTLQIPEGASVVHRDDKWVAYKINIGQKQTS